MALSLSSEDLRHVPMDEAHFPRVLGVLRQGVAEGVAPGFVAGVWSASKPAQYRAAAVGCRRLVPSALPLSVDTHFDLASVTKIYGTATLAARLVDRGWIDWNQPLRSILPQFRDDRVTLTHLLAHTGGLPAWFPFYEKLRTRFAPKPVCDVSVAQRQKAMRELVFEVPLENEPGAKAVYSDLSFLLLGFALEEVTALPLDRAVERWVWGPMGIRNSSYRRVTSDAIKAADERFAATEDCPWRGGVLQGQVHDDNCWAMGGYGGHAGAFGPIGDLMTFGSRLFSGFLSPAVRDRAWTRVVPPLGPPGCDRTPGWDTPSGEEPSLSRRFSSRSVGHLGFTGTSLWLDPDAGLAIALLSNRVHPTRENTRIKAFRPTFHSALADDLSAMRD